MTYINVSEKPVVSREFLLGEAFLNYLAATFPQSLADDGAAVIGAWVLEHLPLSHIRMRVMQQYNRLLEKYQEASDNITMLDAIRNGVRK